MNPIQEVPAPGPENASQEFLKSHPCDQCRRRKVKCDGKEICERCITSGLRYVRPGSGPDLDAKYPPVLSDLIG
jgi:Fungal Zn(2)-Cys(6) binuclear cluster domain